MTRETELYGDSLCHCMGNNAGRFGPGFPDRRMLREQEGVAFKENGV